MKEDRSLLILVLLSIEKIVYVDETGIDKFLHRKYALALRGEKVYERVRGNKFERTSIVAAQVRSRIIAGDDDCTGSLFKYGS